MPLTQDKEELTDGQKSRVPKRPTGSWFLESSVPAHGPLTSLEVPAAGTDRSAKVKEHHARCCTGGVTNSLFKALKAHIEKNQQLMNLVISIFGPKPVQGTALLSWQGVGYQPLSPHPWV